MKLFAAAGLLTLAAIAACTSAPDPPAPSYFVMRHLHKAAGQDPALSEQGQRAAQRLAALLGDRRISAIFVSTTRRARETAAPLAARLGIIPAEYDPSDTPALVARVRQEPGPVLVVGHSNTVPDIVQQLGGPRPADLTHPNFGDLWRIGADGTTVKSRIP